MFQLVVGGHLKRMKFRLLAVFLLPLLMSMGAVQAQAQAQIQTEQPAPAPGALPIEAYGRLPSLEMMSVSPDGSKVAYVKAFKEGRMWFCRIHELMLEYGL